MTPGSNGGGAPGAAASVVLFLCNTAAQNWAADTVVGRVRAMARDGRKIVLADFDFEDPRLHRRLERANGEGVSDFFLYGASLEHIAIPVEDDLFVLLPAGTYALDIDEIYRSERWATLVSSVEAEHAVLVVVAPLGGIDLDAISRWTRYVTLVGSDPDSDLQRLLDRAGLEITEVIESPAARSSIPLAEDAFDAIAAESEALPASPPPPPTPVPGASAAPPRPRPVSPPTDAPPPSAATSARTAPRDGRAPVILHRAPESELELPPPVRRKQPERRTSMALLWVIFLLILVGTAAYLLATIRPDLIERALPNRATPISVEGDELTAGSPAEPLAELLPYSVHVNAFATLEAARNEVTEEGDRLSTVPFFVSPQEIQGTLYYRVLSGLAPDTAGAVALRDRLGETGAIGEDDPVSALGLIQFTPLAFDLGLYPTAEAAVARSDSLEQIDIPSYTASVEYSDGSRRWQVYGGAYIDSTSANAMREMLEAAGLETLLTARTGSPAILTE